MKTRFSATTVVTPPRPSDELRAAALAGLLCLATVACSHERAPQEGEGHITSSENVGVMTEAEFTVLCDERGGTVEVMPHCGGFATAKGFSYDNATLLLSEHTCAGANTCRWLELRDHRLAAAAP